MQFKTPGLQVAVSTDTIYEFWMQPDVNDIPVDGLGRPIVTTNAFKTTAGLIELEGNAAGTPINPV